jgi:trk system potassium uptake protein
MLSTHQTKISPGRILLSSFMFVIAIGTTLLSLPIAQVKELPFINVLFTAASTTCVTGLQVVPLSSFTFFGQFVILCLIQIGGLGLMTLSFFLISLFLDLGMATQLVAGQMLDFKIWSRIKSFLLLIISITFGIEFIGAACLYLPFRATMETSEAIFHSIFHSVSAFCNAGISLIDNSPQLYQSHPFILSTLSFLVFAGSLGFIVWYELLEKLKLYIASLFGQRRHILFTLHTKIVLLSSTVLVLVGAIVPWIIEHFYSFKELSYSKSFFISFCNSLSLRSAGFHIIDIDKASLATLVIFLILMFIGASPNSTGSGVKTTTFVISFATMSAIIQNRNSIELFGRTIPMDIMYKAIAIIALSITWIVSLVLILLITDSNFTFFQIFFEAISAFSTCGLTTGITPHLSVVGKSALMLSMLVGRIGSLTLILALRRKKAKALYHYPEERLALS